VTRFSPGNVLWLGLRLAAKNLVRFFPVIAVLHAPIIYALVLTHFEEPGVDQVLAATRAQNWMGLVFLIEIPLAAILSHAIATELRGAPVSVLESLGAGLRRTPHAFVVMLIIYLVVIAVSLALTIPMQGGVRDGVAELAGVLGIAYLIVLVALYTRWFVAIPAVVMERPGLAGALTRSGELTAGKRPQLAGVLVATFFLMFGLLFGIGAVIGASGFEIGPDDATPWGATITLVVFILFNTLRAAMSAVAYQLIRAQTEAQSPEQLAKVFD
jgi:hypothetical protein